ncbi:MAG: thioredoxin family protein [Tannerellaceae bacterium]|nr:thioredoxin family protein [Tannerellaceae bacterium]
MKVRTYVLAVTTAIVTMSAATKDPRPVEGVNPGDLVPEIESFGELKEFSFQNHSQRYTLLNFWAAYDVESRMRNIRLANEVNKFDPEKIALVSVSLDESKTIFQETIRIDQLNETTQFHDELGKESVLYKKFKLGRGLRNFLVNEKGVIIATNVTPEKLTEVLQAI